MPPTSMHKLQLKHAIYSVCCCGASLGQQQLDFHFVVYTYYSHGTVHYADIGHHAHQHAPAPISQLVYVARPCNNMTMGKALTHIWCIALFVQSHVPMNRALVIHGQDIPYMHQSMDVE